MVTPRMSLEIMQLILSYRKWCYLLILKSVMQQSVSSQSTLTILVTGEMHSVAVSTVVKFGYELRDAMEELTRLNPKPGNSGSESSRTIHHVIPDFLLAVEGEDMALQLNGRNAPDLRISPSYKEMMDTYAQGGKQDKATKEALTFVKQKVDAAKWFVDAIAQRQHTLMKTMRAILDHQQAYFLSGDEVDLKPMILKDIAERIGMDISTVSRVANSKYVQTPYGTLSLKSFFSEGLSTDSGEEVSSREVKKILEEAIAEENKKKPLSDEKLGVLLNAKGYNIARRTVAKYREQLGIPVARLRKEL